MADGRQPDDDRIVSYAQNLEDVILHRALSDVDSGRYVDVGAAWPTFDSVTRHFYDRGWSGLNIEPNPALLAELVHERPRDVNLGVAVSDAPGTATFAVVDDTGLSTLDLELAGEHRGSGRQVTEIEVEVTTLAALLEQHMGSDPIHFLKIDVEGLEAQVIAGNDWSRFRPWIVLAETVTAGDVSTANADWEQMLLDRDYLYAYADGVNRFYVAAEQRQRLAAFSVPPNIFDGYITIRLADTEMRLVAAEAEISDLNWRLGLATQRADWLEQEVEARQRDAEWRLGVEREAARGRERAALLVAAEAQAETDAEHSRFLLATTQVAERDHHINRLHSEIAGLLHQIDVYRNSKSWKLTRPLRIAISLRQAPGPGLRFIAAKLLRRPAPLARPAPAALAPPVEQPMSPAQSDFRALIGDLPDVGEQ